MHVVPPADPADDGPVLATGGDAAARLRSLLDLVQVISAARRLDDLVETAAEACRRALDATALSISRWDRESGLLRTEVNVGLLGPGETRFPKDELYTLMDWPDMTSLVQDRVSFIVTADDETPEGRHLAARGRDSALSVPIVVESRVWGELWAARTAGQPRFRAVDLAFAEALATQVAAGVVQADHLARVERLAFTDSLTGLANRRAVDERLDEALAAYAATSKPVSIILADINRLKQVNDTFGHEAGDRLIISVAEAVSQASGLAQNALAARIGGDEFCVVVDDAPLSEAIRVAEELCRLVDVQPMNTGVSCGVASTELLTGPLDNAIRLFRLADAAQYRAKRASSRRPVVAGRTLTSDAPEPTTERRARRGRLSTDVPSVLESGLAVLDNLSGAATLARLEAVADHLREALDGGGWWVSRVAAGETGLAEASTWVARRGATKPDADAVYDLRDYPVTLRAIEEAASFFVEIGMPGNDPAEESALIEAGYQAVIGAGAADVEAGWLVEVYADSISLPMAAFEPVLRALVAVAVAGAAGAEPSLATSGAAARASALSPHGA